MKNQVEYVQGSIVVKTIMRKLTGSISVLAFDKDEVLKRPISRFDNFIQVVEGSAEITINDESSLLQTGQSMIIPAYANNSIRANVRFKMTSTVIKNGYEEMT